MDLETFILIGGRSTRFGSDKAFFEIDGERMATRMARVARAACLGATVRFVAGSEVQFGERVHDLDEAIVFDAQSGFGAWSGIHAALSYSRATWTLVLACDLPFVTSELLKRLLAGRADEMHAVVPRQADGRLQPLCALYRTHAALRLVDGLLDAGQKMPSLTTIFDGLHSEVIEAGHDELRNVNFLDDLA